MADIDKKNYFIAIIGGGISGSEAAFILASKGYQVIVFEMNELPYGKIEDGLPKWHVGLRDKQEKSIDEKLDHKNIQYVPKVKIGKDISFKELVTNWGFSVVILANGAWKDRVLPVEGIQKLIDHELIYQNPLMYWYNHRHEAAYNGPDYEIKDGAVVIGGGLASLDVIKLGMIELVQNTLYAQKGIFVNLFEFEKKGIAAILKSKKTNLKELGIEGMRLIYRRTARDMPLKASKDETPENIEKAKQVSEKLLQKYIEKYLFHFVPLSIPIGITEKDGRLKSLVLQKVTIEDGEIKKNPGDTYELPTNQIISSIGSLPEHIDGLQYEGDKLKMKEKSNYRVFGYTNVFAIGNAVTGKGNIQESRAHGRRMTERIIEEYLPDKDLLDEWLESLNTEISNKVEKDVENIEEFIKKQEIIPESVMENILLRARELQQKVAYKTYADWIKLKTPVRLENFDK